MRDSFIVNRISSTVPGPANSTQAHGKEPLRARRFVPALAFACLGGIDVRAICDPGRAFSDACSRFQSLNDWSRWKTWRIASSSRRFSFVAVKTIGNRGLQSSGVPWSDWGKQDLRVWSGFGTRLSDACPGRGECWHGGGMRSSHVDDAGSDTRILTRRDTCGTVATL